MSRTDNTMPFRIQEVDRNDRRKRYPPHWGGIYKGIGRYRKRWWRAERNKVKMTLKKGIEPEPTRHRNFCKWDYW